MYLDAAAQECGATASVVLLQTLDNPSTPFFASDKVSLTVVHVGYAVSPNLIQLTIPDLETHFPSCGLLYRYIRDTRVLLTSTDGAKVIPMTENHHAEARVESVRLRRMMGSGLITDSFGEARCVPPSMPLFL